VGTTNKNIVIVSILFSIILFTSGCFQGGGPTGNVGLTESQKETLYVCSSGDKVSNPDLCPKVKETTPVNEPAPVEKKVVVPTCPYECCPKGDSYQIKGCTGGTICVNNQCIQENCPFECCAGIDYKIKECNYNEDCLNKKCVKKSCPFECCDEDTYQGRYCSAGYHCVNNTCEEIPEVKLSVQIDECVHGFNLMQGWGEVTDVYVSINNYGNLEAQNLQINATATDEERDTGKTQGTVSSFPTQYKLKTKLVLDTKKETQTQVTVTISGSNFQTITTSTADCHYNLKYLVDTAREYTPIESAVEIAGVLI